MPLTQGFVIDMPAGEVLETARDLPRLARSVPGLVVTGRDGTAWTSHLTPRDPSLKCIKARLWVGESEPGLDRTILSVVLTHVHGETTAAVEFTASPTAAADTTTEVTVSADVQPHDPATERAADPALAALARQIFDQFIHNFRALLETATPPRAGKIGHDDPTAEDHDMPVTATTAHSVEPAHRRAWQLAAMVAVGVLTGWLLGRTRQPISATRSVLQV